MGYGTEQDNLRYEDQERAALRSVPTTKHTCRHGVPAPCGLCSRCAKCQGIEPWASRFAQCMQRGWIVASQAVREGIASDVSPE